MKNCFRSACIALCACLLALPAVAAPYKQEYKLSVVPGATSGWGLTATYFADLVRERSQGRINIKVYASSQLLAGKSGQMMIDAVEKKGVKIIGWAENGFRELTTSKGPITTPADLNGLKIRVVGSPIFIETFRALGANPVNMNWSEATTGFQQGVVDGQENPTNGINVTVKIWNYHKHQCDWHYIIDPLLMGVNPKVWQGFTPEDQKLLVECAVETEKYGKALSRLGMDDGASLAYLKSINMVPEVADPYTFLEQQGMTVTKLNQEQIAAFYDATKGVREAWIPKIGADLVKAAEEDMASVR